MDERVNILVEAWRQAVEQGANYKALLIIFTVFIAVVIFFMFWMKVKELISLKYLKKAFIDEASMYGLTPEEAEILWTYSRKLKRDPFLTLEIKATFEKVIQQYTNENPDFDDNVIRNIRKKLGFDTLPEYVPLVTSKDIDIFQTGKLFTESGKSYSVALYDKDERFMYWLIIDAVPPFDFGKGDKVKLKFLRKNDGIYTIEGEIVDMIREDDKYILKIPHVFKMDRVQRRREFRINVQFPVTLIVKEGENELSINAEAVDISSEGLRACIPEELHQNYKINIGKDIKVDFQLDNRSFSFESIVKNINREQGRVCYGLHFMNMESKDKEAIVSYIIKVEQELVKKYRNIIGRSKTMKV
ncbi:flagellar brake protein [Persephonella sp.]